METKILGVQNMVRIESIIKQELKGLVNEVDITPSKLAQNNICNSKKFCDAQGQITFGQLKELVESGRIGRIATHIGEGGYKALLRLIPWFLPQLALLGFGATWVRVVNKLMRPTLEETTNYKTWWGKTILKVFDLVEGELNASDPLSKIFFISDGLMTMLDDKYKVKFAIHVANLASEQPDDEIVPDYFVENELRSWLNQKFLLDPPLQPKVNKNDDVDKLPFDNEDGEFNISESQGSGSRTDNRLTQILTKEVILERIENRQAIREIVYDIIKVYKSEDEGEFYLPEYFDEESIEYNYKNLNISLELKLEEDYEIDTYKINAALWGDDDIVTIVIKYNPEKKFKILYDLLGDLNETLAHEFRHYKQRENGLYDMDSEEPDEPLEYYTQPHEIDAQIAGFKRLEKLSGKPFEEVMVNWFNKNKDIHNLNPNEVKIVMSKIMSEKDKR